jgi:DNA-binding protein YbaB
MSIKRTIITTIVALALVAVVAPVAGVSAQTMTIAQLMAEIQSLTAQLQQLQGSTTTTTTGNTTTNSGVPAACAGVTFTKNLVVGATGQDVKCLQSILNLAATTQVSATGAGSPGMETMTFGPKTLAAVKIWQAAAGLVPANQIGPMSRAKLNAWLGGTTTTTTTTTTTNTNNPPPTQGPVSAMVSSDSPAAGAIVNGQASADLLHIAFSGTGTVTSVTLQRSGISDQNALTNVYLYDGNTRITDGYSFNIAGQLVINGLSIAVSGSHVISVRGDVATATAPITESSIQVTMTSYSSGTAPTSANVAGSMMQIVAGNLATASLSANTVSTAANVNAGTTQYTFWSAPLQVNTRSVLLKVANFRMIGSAPIDALSNITMFVDGVSTGKTATVTTINGSNYAQFDLTSAPLTLMTGSHTIDMRADVQKGTNRNVTVSIQQASDLTINDPQVGVNIAVTGTVPNSAAQITILTGSTTVNTSTAFTAMTNISGGSTNAVIGQFTVHAYGENVKVLSLSVLPALSISVANGAVQATAVQYVAGVAAGTTLVTVTNGGLGYIAAPAVTITDGTCTGVGVGTATIAGGKVTAITTTGLTCAAGQTFTVVVAVPAASLSTTVGGLNNVTLYFNGSQIGSQQNWTPALMDANTPLTFQLGSQMIAPAGQDSTLEVRADLQDSADVSYTAGIVSATIPQSVTYNTANAQGQSSQNSVNFPTATVTPNTLTIQTGLLVVSPNSAFLGQALAPNTTGAKIGSYVIQNQSTSESIRLTSLNLVTDADGNTTPSTTADITNLAALRTSDTTGSGSTPIQPTGADTFSVNDVLAPGAQMTVDIFANTGALSTGHYIMTKLTVASIGSVDNIAAAGTQQTGQIMTLGVGTVNTTPTIVVSSTTPAQYISAAGGATNASQATFNFVSTSGTATINELKFTVSGSDVPAGVSQTVTNVCVGSVCASPVSNGTKAVADLTGLALPVPNGGGGLTQNVQVSYSNVGTTGIAPATNVQIRLSYVKYQAGGGSTTSFTPDIPAYLETLVGSHPILTVPTTVNTGLNAGNNVENQVGSVTVAADTKGAVKVHQITFKLGFGGWTAAPTTVGTARLANGNTTINGSYCVTGAETSVVCYFTSDGNVASGTYGVSGNTNYASDFLIAAGQSQTFNLYVAFTDGTATTAGSTASVSTSVYPTTGFTWDDTSTNGGTDSTQLTGALIYNFPTNAYSIHQ